MAHMTPAILAMLHIVETRGGAGSRDLAGHLLHWASYGIILSAKKDRTSLEAAHSFVSAAQKYMDGRRNELEGLIVHSNRLFAPLSEPLAVDMGVHRWLSGQREERYSDWLHWVLEQLGRTEDLFSVLGIEGCIPNIPSWQTKRIRCEESVEEGHEGHAGRLDIQILYPKELVIVIEIKISGGGDVIKNRGYVDSIESKYVREHKRFLFLTPRQEDDPNEDLPGKNFQLLLWSELCLRLRGYVVMMLPSGNYSVLAMILAFVGAVEQNLLGFSRGKKNPLSLNSRTVDHLHRFLGRTYENEAGR